MMLIWYDMTRYEHDITWYNVAWRDVGINITQGVNFEEKGVYCIAYDQTPKPPQLSAAAAQDAKVVGTSEVL